MPSISHVDQFCLTQGHVNCQGAITRPTANRSMTSGRTQCHRTSIKRNREHQSHECLQSFLTHSFIHSYHHSPRSTIPRDAPPCDNVLMTTQTVMATTKSNHLFPAVHPTLHTGRQAHRTLACTQKIFLSHRGGPPPVHSHHHCAQGPYSHEVLYAARENSSSPQEYFAAMFQEVAVVLMLIVS